MSATMLTILVIIGLYSNEIAIVMSATMLTILVIIGLCSNAIAIVMYATLLTILEPCYNNYYNYVTLLIETFH